MHDRRQWLRQLRPSSDRPIPEAVSRPDAVTAVVEAIGEGPVEWARQTGFDMASRIGDEIGDFSHSGDVFALLRMGTESCVLQALTYLQLSADEDAVPDPGATITPEASLGAVEFVQRGISLDAVLRGIRLGHAELQDALYSILRQVVKTDDLATEMQRLAELLFVFVDAWSSDMARDYTAEHQRYSVSRAASRVATIRAVLDGSLTDAATASAQLGYDLTRAHVAIVIWRPSDQSGPALESQATEVLESLGATKTLIAPVGISSVWGWGSRTSFPSTGGATFPSLSPGTRLTIGEPATGVVGFRSTHEQAAAAKKLLLTAPRASAPVVRYADVAIGSVFSSDMERAREITLRELRELADDTPRNGELRETVLCYLRKGNSAQATAEELFISRNTVSYRLRQAVDTLGHELDERPYELFTALMLAEMFGPAVLS